jgi:hypothetical protein
MEDGADGNPKPYVTTGADCLQVTAIQTGITNTDEAADWSIATEPSPGDEPCIQGHIGHIPNLLNSLVGSQFSALTVTNRVIDKDPFWVQVTPNSVTRRRAVPGIRGLPPPGRRGTLRGRRQAGG